MKKTTIFEVNTKNLLETLTYQKKKEHFRRKSVQGLSWVRQMMLMHEGLDIKAGIDWLTTLAVTKEDLDTNPNYFKVPYKNDVATATRTAMTEKGEEALDCSELVCRYLQKIGWSKKVKWLNTKGLYYYADKFPEHLKRHESLDYKPKIGDIFLWKKESGMGHTGVVIEYNESTDSVTTIESISENEYPSRISKGENSGHEGYNFKGVIKWKWNKRTGRHLLSHKSGICRFYTPKSKTK